MALISGKVTTDGKPLLLKLRDERDEYRQELKYYKPQGDEKYGHMSVVKWGFSRKNSVFPDVIIGAGTNDIGFTISNTTVSNYNILAEATNSNIDLINYAITRCKSLEDFEEILNNWHKIKKITTINGNFEIMDANGRLAMYEAYIPVQGAKVIWEKFDPEESYDTDGTFLGFVVRTNDNQWSPFRGGHVREARLKEILKKLVLEKRLNYKTLIQEAAKDTCGDQTEELLANKNINYNGFGSEEIKNNTDIYNFNTEGCISKYNTRFGLVAVGSEDKEGLTIWVTLSEPDIGIFTPYFPLTRKVPMPSWADPESTNIQVIDQNSSSILNNLIAHKGKLFVYDNLKADIILGGLYAKTEVDRTINLINLKKIQEKLFPIQEQMFENYENFMKNKYATKNKNQLFNFSNEQIKFLIDNYPEMF